MKKIEQYLVDGNQTILHAMKKLDELPIKTLFVVENNVLKASVTDGDIRRAILRGEDLEASVHHFANYSPIAVCEEERYKCKDIIKKTGITIIPILNKSNEIVDLYSDVDADIKVKDNLIKCDIPVVIMAGGKGTRLYPYTKILPKPLIPIDDTPISERIIELFFQKGFHNFFMILNYKKNMIKAYFGEVEKKYNLNFFDEEEALGTGGGVKLVKDYIHSTFVLTNCDILIMEDIYKILEHHKKEGNHVTMVCSLKNYQVPYGVVKFSEGGVIEDFEEKPQMSFFTNTGYYILEPEVFDYINENENVGMPTVIMRMKNDHKKVGIYPIGENSWLDMGQMDSMDQMENRLKEIEMEKK